MIRIIGGYKISIDFDQVDGVEHHSEEIKEIILHYYQMVQKGRAKDIQKLIRAVEKYPRVVQLKNYLSSLYNILGNEEKAFSINQWILRDHPDYLFAKINLCTYYIYRAQYQKIPELLGETLELRDLYPNRKVFHEQEYTSYTQIVAMYFAAIGDYESCVERLGILKEIDPRSVAEQEARDFMTQSLMKKALLRNEEEQKGRIRVETKQQES